MAGLVGRWQHFGRWTLTACSALVCIAALQGCAANNAAALRESEADLVTPSDESEARRRARICPAAASARCSPSSRARMPGN